MKFDNSEMISDQRKKFICGAVEGFYGRPWSSDQRQLLFCWLKKMGLNTYMYAPKDDCKHRAFWRELYSVEEAENMTTLIDAAKEQNIEFIYALSPGLDITFSSAKDVQCLKRKLEQVSTFGCKAFALLFDDIDPDLSEADRSVFHSFGSAQVSVSNEVFEHIGPDFHFYFCPTEYCSSRAVPDISASEYLNTIGSKLLPDVEILWTGNKVITKKITVQHLMQISATLRRPPVIWDNIHANDYDPRRMFLGPYDGRSPEVIPYLRGVLTNPNCEFEMNYIALHTLGQWAKSNLDGLKKDVIDHERLSPVASDIKLETESDPSFAEDLSKFDTRYQPRYALRLAVKDWMLETGKNRLPPTILTPNTSPAIVPATPTIQSLESAVNMANPVEAARSREMDSVETEEGGESFMQPLPLMNPLSNSLVSAPIPIPTPNSPSTDSECCSPVSVASSASIEPMDVVHSNGTEAANKNESLIPMEFCANPSNAPIDNDVSLTEKGSLPLGRTNNDVCSQCLEEEELALLVDLFYLPFEHGSRGEQILQQFHWLKCNSYRISHTNTNCNNAETAEWYDKADNFIENASKVCNLAKRLYDIPNNSLTCSVFPYLWDLHGVMEVCSAYVSWMKLAKVPSSSTCNANGNFMSWCSYSYRDAFSNGEVEPWVFRGGLQGELERLLPVKNCQDLSFLRAPDVVLKKHYKYRPYKLSDEAAVYNICLKTCDDGTDGTEVFPEYPQLIGDRIVGAMTTLSPEYCFVVEDEDGVCGYAVGCLNMRDQAKKADTAWVPALKEKYPLQEHKEQLSPADEVIMSIHNDNRPVPECVLEKFISAVRVDFIPHRVVDYSVPKRLLMCAINAMKTNGSQGVHVEMNVGDKCMIDHYRRLGFCPVTVEDPQMEDLVYLGRVL